MKKLILGALGLLVAQSLAAAGWPNFELHNAVQARSPHTFDIQMWQHEKDLNAPGKMYHLINPEQTVTLSLEGPVWIKVDLVGKNGDIRDSKKYQFDLEANKIYFMNVRAHGNTIRLMPQAMDPKFNARAREFAKMGMPVKNNVTSKEIARALQK